MADSTTVPFLSVQFLMPLPSSRVTLIQWVVLGKFPLNYLGVFALVPKGVKGAGGGCFGMSFRPLGACSPSTREWPC